MTEMTETTIRSQIHKSKVMSRREVAPGLVVLKFENSFVARNTLPGQFVNVLPKIGFSDPLLRRTFIVYNIDGNNAEIIIDAERSAQQRIGKTDLQKDIDKLTWKRIAGNKTLFEFE